MEQYIKQFTNNTAYNAVKDNLDRPNVVLCTQENEMHYNPYVDLIYFKYIGGDTVPALRGMTWEEYVNSEYNTSQYTNMILSIKSGNVIRYHSGVDWYLADENDVLQHSTDIISETKTYGFPAD